MKKKYEFTGEILEHNGHKLHRIRALVAIANVAEGDLGGWIESEYNLSHYGNAWVFDNAKVFADAEVSGNAKVYWNAEIYGNAKVCGDAEVYIRAKVCGNAFVSENAKVCGDVKVYGDADVYGSAEIFGHAEVFGHAKVQGLAAICDNAKVYDNAEVCGNAAVYGCAEVYGRAEVYGSARVHGIAHVCGNTWVDGKAILRDGRTEKTQSYICMGPVGSRDAFTTLNLTSGTVCTGCFKGTIDEFEAAVKKAHGDNEHGKVYRNVIALFRATMGGYQLCDDSLSKVDGVPEVAL